MGKVISVINEKGGVGKSTTASALIFGLSMRGYKTLGIDLDSQGDLTRITGGKKSGASIFGAMMGECRIEDAIQHTPSGDLIASSLNLKGADLLIPNRAEALSEETGENVGSESILKMIIEEIKDQYDFIIIDNPRASGSLTTNSLTASDLIIAPTTAEPQPVEAIERLAVVVDKNRQKANKNLKIAGILLTCYDGRSIMAKDMTENAKLIAKNHNTKVFNTKIRRGVAIQEAQAYKQNIFDYDSKAKPIMDYNSFIDELLEDLK